MTNRSFSNRLNQIIFLPLVLLTLVLMGCATDTNLLETLDKKTVLMPDQGIVVVRIVNATDYPLPMNQVTIAPDNLNESETVKFDRLSALDVDLDGSTVFASPTKAGTYALSSIRAYHFRGDYYYSHFAATDAKFGTFQIKAGQVTDLGTIIYYHKPQEDKYLQMLVRAPETSTGEVLKKYFPFYNFNPNQLNTWLEDEREEQRETDYLTIAQNPTVFEDAYKAPDGSLYFLGKLGVFIIRTPDGEWQIDAVDTNFNLNTITQNSMSDIIVGGEEGKLFWKPSGSEWQDMSLSHDVQIAQLKFYNDDYIDMITKSDSLLTVNRAKVAPILDWQELNRYTTRDGWKVKEVTEAPVVENKSKPKRDIKQKPKSLKEIASVELTELNQQHYINVRTINSYLNRAFEKGDLEKFAYYPDSWKVFNPEIIPEVTTMIQAGATKLGITEAGFWSWTGRPTFTKYDSATNSWQEISTSMRICPDGTATLNKKCPAQKEGEERPKSSEEDFSLISVPLFFNETDALAIVNFSDFDFWSGERSNDIKILKTTDGGKNWLDTGNTTPTKFCTSLITEISDRLLVSCSGATGDFYESFDEGKTWQNVRQQLNF